MNQDVWKLLVVGTGTMGAGIAQVAAAAGCTVHLYDQAQGVAVAAKHRIHDSLERARAKGYVTADAVERTQANLVPVMSLDIAGQVHAVIEAIKENLAIKRAFFAQIETLVARDTALWTNTSMLSISRIAEGLQYPQRLVGTHFFNPVPRMKLVEVIAGRCTGEPAVEQAEATVTRWGKTPVRAPDTPGFIVNRIFDAIKREALQLVEEGTPPEQVDLGVRLGLNFPMGPFEVMDLIGLDTTLDCLKNQAHAMQRAADFGTRLPKLVAQGKYGRKSGEGFYRY